MSGDACLVLANGQVFYGKSFGATGCITGEAVFTTGMVGYIETLTDPSYYGQIVTQTFPLNGNYGVIHNDFESSKCHLRGYIVRSYCDFPSNFRCEKTVDEFLKSNNIIGLADIDTRMLTKILREVGVMNARIISGTSEKAKEEFLALTDKNKKESLLREISEYKIVDAVNTVSKDADKINDCAENIFENAKQYKALPIYNNCIQNISSSEKSITDRLYYNTGKKILDYNEAIKSGFGKKVALLDFGAKANIRRELLKRGAKVISFPSNATAKDILSCKPNGIMLSNGPGDPAENVEIIENIKKLCDSSIPIFGICLGHQLLALARGAKTAKLKYGHRGANQPVKHLPTGRVYISSQNHGYAVENASLPNCAELSFVNVNDGSCEGIKYNDIPSFSVQFHPEASSGPLDLNFLFDEFINLINDTENKNASK